MLANEIVLARSWYWFLKISVTAKFYLLRILPRMFVVIQYFAVHGPGRFRILGALV
jgi:hypothetical protein